MKKILLVDDDAMVRRVGEVALKAIGKLEVLTAEGGERALTLLEKEQVDAIVIDVMMPGMDGPATIAKLRERPGGAEIPVVFLTAISGATEDQRLLALGVAGVIAKPFDPSKLAARLRELVAAWSAR